ncbi:MAG: ATP phosphoribosyltransferase [Bacteroidetes bacterium]|nr:ATP phosphoribosyltransferase [Bacteroidota bacterium]
MLKIAVQKSGRLNEGSLSLLKDCGIVVENGTDKLKAEATGFPLEVIFLRNSDIPEYVQDGVVHCGIIGENVLVESMARVEVVQKLGFSRCRLSIAVPKEVTFTGPGWLQGKRIATSYPNSLRAYLNANNIQAETHLINGSVEIAPSLGLADAVCDLVSSGNTLFSNGLKEVEVLLRSEAILVASHNLSHEARSLLEKLLFRIQAVLNARKYSYVLLNCPEEKIEDIIAILPGMKSPTIMPLAQKGWYSLHSVVHENDFWNHIDALKANGAEGILIIPIEKMIY